jgi:tape measure domain-containing protein
MGKDTELKLRITADNKAAIDGLKKVDAGIEDVGEEAKRTDGALDGMTKGLLNAANVMDIAGQLKAYASGIAELASIYAGLEGRLKTVTGSQEETNEALDDLVELAIQTHTPLQATADLYTKLARATKDNADAQADLLPFTRAINDALRINGTKAQEAEGALLQLSQALASGALRGEEFNSVNEQMPAVLDAVAEYLGRPRSELKALAEQGKLTSDIVRRAVVEMGEEWRTQAESLPVSIAAALGDVETAWIQYLGQSESVRASTAAISGGLTTIAENLDDIVPVAGAAVAALGGLKIAKALNLDLAAMAASTKASAAALPGLVSGSNSAAASMAKLAAAEQMAAVESLKGAQARKAAAVAALAEANALLTDAKNVGLYGEARASAERKVTAAKAANAAASQALTAAEAKQSAAAAAVVSTNAAVTVSARAAAASMGLLNKVMGALGGPAGLILTAVSALSVWSLMSSDAADETDALTEKLREQKAALKDLSDEALTAYRENLETAIASGKKQVALLRQQVSAQSNWVTQLQNGVAAATDLSDEEAELKKLRDELLTKTQLLAQHEKDLTQTRTQEADQLTDLGKRYSDLNIAMDAVSKALDQQEKTRKAVTTAALAQIDAEETLAKAAGDQVGVLQAQQAAMLEKAKASAADALAAQQEADAQKVLLDALEAYLDKHPQQMAAKQAELIALRANVEQKSAEAKASKAQAEAAQFAATQAAATTKTYGDQSAQLAQLRAAADSAAVKLERIAAAQRDAASAAVELQSVQASLAAAQKAMAEASEAGNTNLAAYINRIAELTAHETALKEQIEAGAQATAAETKARQAAAIAAERYADSLADAIVNIKAEISDLDREASLLQQSSDLRALQLSNLQKEAEARGDTAEATRLNEELARLELDTLKEVAEAKQQAADAAELYVEALIEQAEADKDVTQAERDAIEAAEDAAEAKQIAADAAYEAARGAQTEADAKKNSAKATKEETEEEEKSVETKAKVALAVDALAAKYAYLGDSHQAFIRQLLSANATLWEHSAAVNRAYAAAEKYAESVTISRQRVAEFVDQLSGLDNASEQTLTSIEANIAAMGSLDDADLSGVRSQIERLRAANNSLNDSLQDTIDRLKDELDARAGNESAIQERAFRQEMIALEELLQQARLAGDSEAVRRAEEAMALARRNHEEKMALIRAEMAAAQAANDAAQQPPPITPTAPRPVSGPGSDPGFGPGTTQPTNPSPPISRPADVILRLENGARLSGSQSDIDAFVAALEEAGMTATANY